MNDNTGRIDNLQEVQLKNLREDLKGMSYRPVCSVQPTMQDNTSGKKELIKTREEWEMVKNGLGNVFNLSITNHTEIMNYKNCSRSLIETFGRTHNKTCLLYTSRCV